LQRCPGTVCAGHCPRVDACWPWHPHPPIAGRDSQPGPACGTGQTRRPPHSFSGQVPCLDLHASPRRLQNLWTPAKDAHQQWHTPVCANTMKTGKSMPVVYTAHQRLAVPFWRPRAAWRGRETPSADHGAFGLADYSLFSEPARLGRFTRTAALYLFLHGATL